MRTTAAIVGILLLATIPSALAQVSTPVGMAQGWASKGSYEPSTANDTAQFMFQTPNRENVERVYFNGFEDRSDAVVRTTFTPNLAFLGTAHRMTPHDNMAMLGAWIDCNGDGYIGFADHGLLEYRSDLLVGPFQLNICPVKAFPTATNGAKPTHNDGTWVREFIPIGYRSHATIPLDRNYYDDPGARVWADAGVPGAPAGWVCFLSPVPTGTYHTVGSIGQYLDCLGRGKFSTVYKATPTTNDLYTNTLAPIHNPWGEERDQSYVEAFDCSQPQRAHRGLTTANGHETQGVGVSEPKVPVVRTPSGAFYQNGDPSLAGTANETATALDDCNRADNGGAAGDNDGALAHQPYSNEDDAVTNQDTNPPVKIRNDPLYYNEAQRLLTTGAQSQDGGTGQTSTQGIWTAFTVGSADNAFVDVFGPAVPGTTHTTWYAIVPNATTMGLALPPGPVGDYGGEACGTATSGVKNGWNCAASEWNWGTDPHGVVINGVDATTDYTKPMRVHASYQLRDVDCYDESISALRGAGVGWGLVSGRPCS